MIKNTCTTNTILPFPIYHGSPIHFGSRQERKAFLQRAFHEDQDMRFWNTARQSQYTRA